MNESKICKKQLNAVNTKLLNQNLTTHIETTT